MCKEVPSFSSLHLVNSVDFYRLYKTFYINRGSKHHKLSLVQRKQSSKMESGLNLLLFVILDALLIENKTLAQIFIAVILHAESKMRMYL